MMDERTLKSASKKLKIKEVFMINNFSEREESYMPPYAYEKSETKRLQFKQYAEGYQVAEGEKDGEKFEHVIYHYTVGFRLVDNQDNEEEKVLFTCEAEYAAVYLITEELSDKEFEIFGKYNVGYHVWPYWREHCASVSQKNRLPFRVQIPFYQYSD